jgi:putative hemolysin
MYFNGSKVALFTGIMLGALVSGSPRANASAAQSSVIANVGNPASDACVAAGGTSEIYVDGTGAQLGLCAFDGRRIEEWTLWAALNGDGSKQAVQAFFAQAPKLPHPFGPNPASLYCSQVGGTVQSIGPDASHLSTGLCTFPDGSAIEEWALFEGPAMSPTLAKVLGGTF